MTPVVGSKSRKFGLLSMALMALLFVGLTGCKAKPSEKDCQTAINNVRRITGQDSSDMGADPIAVIRSCRGNSSQKSVDCMIAAKSEEDLNACEGAVGTEYFKKEVEASEKRIKESGGGEETGDKPTEAAIDAAPAAEVVPSEGTPSEAVPTEVAPSEGTPSEAAPVEGKSGEAAPKEAAPKEAAPKEAAPKEAAPKTP